MKPNRGQRAYSSPRNFVYVLRRLCNLNSSRSDQREDTRVPKRLSLSLQPLDVDFQPDGDSFMVLSSDVSKRGMGIIVDDPMLHEHIRIDILDENVSVIAVVRHCTSIGTQYPLFLVGVEFLDEYLV